MPKLESGEAVLVHCSLVKNNYQRTSKVLFSFVLNKQFGQLVNFFFFCFIFFNDDERS